MFSMCLGLHFLNEVTSKVDHMFQSAEDQSVDIIVKINFFIVVLHRKDAVHRDADCWAEIFDLHIKETTLIMWSFWLQSFRLHFCINSPFSSGICSYKRSSDSFQFHHRPRRSLWSSSSEESLQIQKHTQLFKLDSKLTWSG